MSAASAKVKIAQSIGKDVYSSLMPFTEYQKYGDVLKNSFNLEVSRIFPLA